MIEPYYQDEFVTLYNAKAEDVLPDLPKVDLVLTDPPYGLNAKMNGGTWGSAYRRGDMLEWDYLLNPELMTMVIESATNAIIWGGNNYTLPVSRCWLVWSKPYMPTLSDVELAWTNFDKPAKLFRCNREPHNGHPTAKPISLMVWCLKSYCDGGGNYS